MDQMLPQDIKSAAIQLLKEEKTSWQDATCFVTDRVAFKMRELIRVLRKNYWGVFDKPTDKASGRDKIWIPLTESVVETSVKNIDLDTKDINLRAKTAEAIGTANLLRHILKDKLDRMGFGELLDKFERSLCIDGTAVWKTIEEKGKDGKPKLCVYQVDLLNFYIDPVAESIEETPAVIERAVMDMEDFQEMDGWQDKDAVFASTGLSPNDQNLDAAFKRGDVKSVEVFERWGLMPKYLLSGNPEDKELVHGHIVVSNLDSSAAVHLIEKAKDRKPYEEAWYTRVPGRWYGRGPAEKVMMLQLWLNTIVNIRITRSYVSQLGIFKIKKGSGVTPAMISRLTVNGALTVNSMEDIEQMAIQEASQASYTDEANIKNWADRVTSSYESVTGEGLPSSTTATSAVLQTRAAEGAFGLVREGLGLFLQRWLKYQAIPIIKKSITRDQVFRITGDPEELRVIDERVVNQLLYKAMSELNKKGILFSVQDVMRERERLMDKFAAMGTDRYVKLLEDVDFEDMDVETYITNENIDKGVLLQNLTTILQTSAAADIGIDPASVAQAAMDVMGVDTYTFRRRKPMQPPPNQPNPQNMQRPPMPNQPGQAPNVPQETAIAQRANVMS